jgi:hypothetical protein
MRCQNQQRTAYWGWQWQLQRLPNGERLSFQVLPTVERKLGSVLIVDLRLSADLASKGLIERDDSEPGIGVDLIMSGDYRWLPVPLRLTADGHEFADALHNHKAFDAVKKSFASSSTSIMRDIAIAALKGELAKHGFGLG